MINATLSIESIREDFDSVKGPFQKCMLIVARRYNSSCNGGAPMVFHANSHAWHQQCRQADSSCDAVEVELRDLPRKVVSIP
jgi:hypothetical protein